MPRLAGSPARNLCKLLRAMPTNALRCPPLVWLTSVGGGLIVWSWMARLVQRLRQMVSIIVVSDWVVHDPSDRDRTAHGAVLIRANLAQLIDHDVKSRFCTRSCVHSCQSRTSDYDVNG